MNLLADWTPAVVPALLAILALWGPGLLVTWALGLSKWRTVAFAPLASAGVIAIATVLGPFIGVRWGWLLYLGIALVVALVALAVRIILAKTSRKDRSTGPRTNQPIPAEPKLWPAFLGTAISMPFTVAAFIKGIGRPEFPTQTWDGMFHLSAIRWILETGNGSTLNLNAVASNIPESASTTGSFYPAGFHDLVALTVTDNVIVATNAAVIVIATILWPLGVAMLSSIFVPKSYALPIFTALLASTFSSFPERPSSYGVLWPVVYAYALVPIIVIVLADWFGRTNQKTMGVKTTFIGILGAIGLGVAHPTGIFVALIAIVILTIDLVFRLVARTLRISKLQFGLITIAIVAFAGGLWFVSQQSAWTVVTNWQREPIGSFLRESFGVIFESQLSWMGYGDAHVDWVLGILTLIGAAVALWMPRTRWLLFTYGLGSYLFVASAVVNVPGYVLVSPWYSDPVRLGAIVPLFGAPIAALGAWGIYQVITRLFATLVAKRTLEAATVTVFVIGLIFGTNYVGYYSGSSQLHLNYEFKSQSGLNGLVSPEELEFIQTLPEYVDKGDFIIGDPRTGLPLVYALTGLDVTYRHVDGTWSKDVWNLGKIFDEITYNPRVCDLLAENKVRYFYTDDLIYWPENPVSAKYEGLEAARSITGAFKPIASGGGATLYEITPCPHVQKEIAAEETGSN